jgi:pilus assembly protein CpaE
LTIVEADDRRLSSFAREAGMEVSSAVPFAQIGILAKSQAAPEVLILDLRGQQGLPGDIAALKRQNPHMGVVVMAAALDPALMLEAIRAGVNEFVTDAITPAEFRATVERVAGHQLAPVSPAKVLAFVGAKGGVGTTTLAVNVATALAADKAKAVLIVDLHVTAFGDVGVLLGVEPKFSVVDALENTSRLDGSYLRTLVARSKSGVDVLASPERPVLRAPDPTNLRNLLYRVSEQYSVVVLDVPPSDFGTIDALDPLTSVSLVVNQELPTVRRAAQVGALLRQRYGKERVGAVVSRYDVRADIGQEDIERVLNLPVWATLPSDYRKVVAAANAGRPIVSDNHSRLATVVTELAMKLAGGPRETPKPKPAKAGGRLGFF